MDKTLLIAGIIAGVAVAAVLTYWLWPESCEGPVTCTSDAQCGGEIIAERFCRDGNVYGNGQVNTCVDAGSCNAQCITTYAVVLLQVCENGCSNGACLA